MTVRSHAIKNDEEAQELLKRLEQYYGQPVLPLGSFCRAMKAWMDCIVKNNTDPALLQAWDNHGNRYFSFLGQLYIDVRKSNLLGRLLYAKEPLRTRMCPSHKGHYNGDAMFFNKCSHLCDGTGWLRERAGDEGFTGIKII